MKKRLHIHEAFFSNFIINLHVMKKISIILIAALGILAWQSCTYDWLETEVFPTPDTVSFSRDIIPIFNARCVSCHKTGGEAPDLSSANAYNDLWSAGLIDIAVPSNSTLYKRIAPLSGTTPAGSMNKYTIPNDPVLILKWIEGGAKNN
jgi:hypothetical protein